VPHSALQNHRSAQVAVGGFSAQPQGKRPVRRFPASQSPGHSCWRPPPCGLARSSIRLQSSFAVGDKSHTAAHPRPPSAPDSSPQHLCHLLQVDKSAGPHSGQTSRSCRRPSGTPHTGPPTRYRSTEPPRCWKERSKVRPRSEIAKVAHPPVCRGHPSRDFGLLSFGANLPLVIKPLLPRRARHGPASPRAQTAAAKEQRPL